MQLRISFAFFAFAVSATAVFAQSPPATKTPLAPQAEQHQSASCAHAGTQATVGQRGDVNVPTPDGKPMSDKLAQSNGVICPPDHVDSAIKAPAPQQGRMPVIPPPGTPGSPNQSVQPK
jgi:hypothetical protein